MADETRDLILRLLLKIDGTKLPPIDTKEAEAALEAFKQKAVQKNQEIAAATAAAGRQGAYAGINSLLTDAGIDDAHRRRYGLEPASYFAPNWGGMPPVNRYGGYFGRPPGWNPAVAGVGPPPIATAPMGGGWANGPISDGGSFGRSSLSSARGYDVAMLREHVSSLNLDRPVASMKQLQQGASQMRESVMGLAASLVLLNNAFDDSSNSWDNWYTKAVGFAGVAAYGPKMAVSGANLVRGGAGYAANALSGLSASAGAGAAGRGLSWGARALGGIAGASALSIAAPVAVGVGLWGARRYYEGQAQDAQLAGDAMDARMDGIQQFIRNRNLAEQESNYRFGLDMRYGSGARSFLAGGNIGGGGGAIASLQRMDRDYLRPHLIGLQGRYDRADAGDQPQLANEIAQTIQQQIRGYEQIEQIQRRITQQSKERAAIERIIGRREGGLASEYLDAAGQATIDANPRLRQYLGDNARTSGQLAEINKKITDLKAKADGAEASLGALVDQMSGMIDRAGEKLRFWQGKLDQQAADQIVGGR